MSKSQDPSENCKCDVFKDDTLRNGCQNFWGLNWNNPTVTYEELKECPAEFKMTPPCWFDNDQNWPTEASATCKAPPSGPGPAQTPLNGCPGGDINACMELCHPAATEDCG